MSILGKLLKFGTPTGAVALATGYGANKVRERNAPKRIGEAMGSSSNFDGMSALNSWQQDQLKNFDEQQAQEYQEAVAQATTNAVRLGQMSPEEANRRIKLSSTNLANTTNSGQLQMGAMSASDLPDATSHLGDYNGLGLDNEYWDQLRNAAILQENITQDIGDVQLSREFDRTGRYRLPIENYRINRDFAYTQKGEQNAMKRQMGSNLLNTYANTAQALMTSGL